MVGKPVDLDDGFDPQPIPMFRNWDDLFGGMRFAPPDAFFGAAYDDDGIALLNATAFAKGGGGGKPGGGGGGSGTVVDSYAAGSADGDTNYDILIDFLGSGWTDDLKAAFKTAADYFTTVIKDDIGGDYFDGTRYIDDLYVSAELKTIDGTGGVLGQAGPTAVWISNELTATGQMEFDVADALTYLDRDLWNDIVTHEMMHVLGFGSLWNYGEKPLVYDVPNRRQDDQYLGQAGLTAYREAGHPDAQFIPVEADGGRGTAGSHWDEAALGSELMTGYINGSNQLSKFSVMSLADLGYSVTNESYVGLIV